MTKRNLTRQELRAYLDEAPGAIDDEILENWWLDLELREAELYLLGIERWQYLWNSPWFEYDAPEWVYYAGLNEQTWWHAWAECPLTSS